MAIFSVTFEETDEFLKARTKELGWTETSTIYNEETGESEVIPNPITWKEYLSAYTKSVFTQQLTNAQEKAALAQARAQALIGIAQVKADIEQALTVVIE